MARYATGKYAKAISDRSGMEFPYKEMVREWNGAFVHFTEFEPKQPQLEPKPNGADGVSLLNTRTDRTEPPTAVALPKDPFTVTNGSATLTVSLLNHNLKVGDFVLFFDGASNAPTQSFNLGSNLFPLFAVTTAMAAADTSAVLDSNTNFPASGFYFIQSPTEPAATNPNNVPVIQREVIQYTGKSGGLTITGLSRGTNAPFRGITNESTTATAHIASSVFPGLEIQSVTTRTENTGAMPATKTVNTGFTVTLPYNAVGNITGGGQNAFVSPMFRGVM
jgi:hypothetical protein|tara:strand:+ start:433 stop:1266 length:834 start_codon:yes stop_codon:yes gene_type:complete